MVVPPENWPDGEVTRGREAWLRQGMRIKDSWESDRVELDQLHEAGSNVIIRERCTANGKASAFRGSGGAHALVRATPRGVGCRRIGTDQVHRRGRPSCREAPLAWRRPGP